MNWNKSFHRTIPYIRKFYSISSIPIQFLAYTSIIYDKIIMKYNILYRHIPTYDIFLGYSFIFIFVFIYGGYLYTKKTRFAIEEIEISVEINPYMNYKVAKVNIPFYSAIMKLCLKFDIDVEDMKKILENSL